LVLASIKQKQLQTLHQAQKHKKAYLKPLQELAFFLTVVYWKEQTKTNLKKFSTNEKQALAFAHANCR
jgi:hypothetical protein